MYQLLETIKIANRKFENIFFHNERMNNSRKKLFGATDNLKIEDIVQVPFYVTDGIYKLRIVYSSEIEKIEFLPYKIKNINKLKLIRDDYLEYNFKFADRKALTNHLQNANDADEIIIIKNGLVTDTSYSNLIFFEGKKWVTPSSYLLNGTKRQLLLSTGKIREGVIKEEDIKKYICLKMINAMIDFDESPPIDIKNIIY